MKPNPILDEIWKIKDDLARESGYDVHRFFETLRQWSKDHPHLGPVVRNAEELPQLVVLEERRRAKASALALSDASRAKS
jgi:hypothetical protein